MHKKLQTIQRLLSIIFDKVDRYNRKYDKPKYLASIHSDEKHERIFDKIRYLVMLKSNISDVLSHKHMKTKIDSDDDLPLQKALNIVIHIKSVLNIIIKNFQRNAHIDNI